MVSDPFNVVGAQLGGKYRVDEVVSEGGFGIVYRGYHLGLSCPIAIKLLKVPPTLDEKGRRAFLTQFHTEGVALAKLDHPSIVRVFDTGAHQPAAGVEVPYLILEWLDGVTLEDHIAARRAGVRHGSLRVKLSSSCARCSRRSPTPTGWGSRTAI